MNIRLWLTGAAGAAALAITLAFAPPTSAQELSTAPTVVMQGSGHGRGGTGGTGACNGTNYVDADGDGVCDNAGTGTNYVDADGDGVCDNVGTGTGTGSQNQRGHGRSRP